jgi:Fe-S cluster biogenesis protein NfuA
MAAPKDEIVRVVRDVLAPLVQADGGELYLVSVDDSGVSLHLAGKFSGCPGNTLARRRVLEPLIASAVPGAHVTMSSGPLVPKGAQRIQVGE